MKILTILNGINPIRTKKKVYVKKELLVLLISFFFTSCQNIDVKGNVGGNESKLKNEILFFHHINENLKIQSKIATPYEYKNGLEKGIPEYAETSLLIEF